jgi:hypothetical protein
MSAAIRFWTMGLGGAAVSLSLLFLSLVTPWFLLAFFFSGAGTLILLRSIVCPKCGTPIGYHRLFGMTVYAPWPASQCCECGENLVHPAL